MSLRGLRVAGETEVPGGVLVDVTGGSGRMTWQQCETRVGSGSLPATRAKVLSPQQPTTQAG